MKSFRRISMGYFVALAALTLFGVSASAEVRHNSAIVRAIRGSAEVSSDKGRTWKPASVGSKLNANSAIRTSNGSTADLFLGENGPVVRVTEQTTLGIDKLDVEKTGIETVIETQLDLRSGKILGSVKKMAAASKYEVKTPVGVAGIRGTEYSIDARGRVSVVTGQVVVVYVVDGVVIAPITVNAGQTAVPPTASTQRPTITTGGPVAGIETLQRGVVTRPDGTLTVTLEDGRVISSEGGITTISGTGETTGPGGPTIPVGPSTAIAPLPGGVVQPNPNAAISDPERADDLTRGTLSPTQPAG